MPIRRRDFIIGSAFGAARIARGQSLSRSTLEALIFSTTYTTSFHPIVTKSGQVLLWAWGNGTYTTNNAPTKSFSAGTKTFRMITFDAFNGVTSMGFSGRLMTGALPSLARFPNLVTASFYNNAFSGVIPSFASATLLVDFEVQTNQFTGVVAGSFATQKSMNVANFSANALTQAAVDQILADFVVSLGIGGRVTNTVNLTGGTNSTPSAAGLANKVLLVAASWTVTNN